MKEFIVVIQPSIGIEKTKAAEKIITDLVK